MMFGVEESLDRPRREQAADLMTVSVVIPAYNRESYIGEAIESVLAQTIPPSEIIVVDDGSTDGTADVVLGFGSRVRLIRIENTGRGPSHPRNIGMAAAAGRYITLLDSDDVFLPTLLEQTHELIARAPHVGMVFNMSYICRRAPEGNGQPVRREYRELLEDCPMHRVAQNAFVIESREAYSRYCKGNYIGTTGVTILRDLWEKVGGFDATGDLLTSNDFDFFFKIIREADIGYLSEPLNIYYHHNTNISAANTNGIFKDYHHLNAIKVLKRQTLLSLGSEDLASINRAITEYYDSLAYEYRVNQRYLDSALTYLKSYRLHPRVNTLLGLAKVPIALVLDKIWFIRLKRPGG